MTDTDTPDRQALVGQSVGPYRVLEELGAGAVGTVYRAVHIGLDRPVALKILRPEMLLDTDSVRRFLREARASARLEHPNIVSVYDAGEVHGQYYIAMKLVEGQTLQDLLRQSGRFSPQRVVHIGVQLASALDYAHGREVVHLDVKPANVIVSPHDDATLSDFSIAQAVTPGATHSSTIAGTPLYMSPEQIQGKELDSRSDIYSLGLVLYEMCVGHPPFQGQFVTVMYAHLHTPVPDIHEAQPQVPQTLVNVIYRALAKDRGERYQTAGELLRALQRTEFHEVQRGGGTLRMGRGEVERLQAENLSDGGAAPRAVVAPLPAVPSSRMQSAGAGTTKKEGTAGRAFVLVAGIIGCLLLLGLADLIHSFESAPAVPTAAPVAAMAPLSSGIHVAAFRLTASYSQDPATGQPVIGPTLTSISARELGKQTIYAVAAFQLNARNGRASFRPRYALHDPAGAQIDTFPSQPPRVVLDANHAQSVFVSGFILQSTSKQPPPLGKYRVDLILGGRTLRALWFSLTG